MPVRRHLFARRFPVRRRAARHISLLALAALALVFVLAGCDFSDDDRRDPGPDVIFENDVRVTTFTLNDQDGRNDFIFSRTLSESGLEVQYEGPFSILTAAAVNEGVVLLYASDQTGSGGIDGLIRNGWTALPIALGVDEDNDFFVDYTLTTTYTYDVNRLYLNLIASNDLGEEQFAITHAVLGNIENIAFRLVTIPGGGFNRTSIDYSDYEAVKRAYNLPD